MRRLQPSFLNRRVTNDTGHGDTEKHDDDDNAIAEFELLTTERGLHIWDYGAFGSSYYAIMALQKVTCKDG